MEREIDEELRSHLEMRAEDNMAQGMTKEEASRDARLRFGNPVALKESVQAMDVALGIEQLDQGRSRPFGIQTLKRIKREGF